MVHGAWGGDCLGVSMLICTYPLMFSWPQQVYLPKLADLVFRAASSSGIGKFQSTVNLTDSSA